MFPVTRAVRRVLEECQSNSPSCWNVKGILKLRRDWRVLSTRLSGGHFRRLGFGIGSTPEIRKSKTGKDRDLANGCGGFSSIIVITKATHGFGVLRAATADATCII